MRRLWKTSLVLSLGFLVTGARGGQESSSPPLGATPAQIERPIATAVSPAATLDRPVPLASSANRVDAQVRPTAFSLGAVIPASSPETAPRPMPVGPAATDTFTMRNNWRQAEVAPPPTPGPVASNSIASTTSSALPSPTPLGVPQGVPLGTPVGTPLGADCKACPAGGAGCDPVCCDSASCGGGICGFGGCCPPGNRYYATAEYLLWWMRGSPLPPLVTSGSRNDTIPGALGQSGTSILSGNQNVGTGPRSGGRLLLGYWFGDNHCLGIEAGGFLLGGQSSNFTASSFGSPILARPFIDAATGTETEELVAGTGALAGTVTVRDRSSLWGYQANLRSNLWCGCNGYIDGIVGFRALGLDDNLSITENLTVLRGAGGNFLINDSFNAQNRFYGAQAGFTAELRRDRWFLDVRSTVALGTTQQIVHVNGSTLISDPVNGNSLNRGGLLAQPTNIGSHHRDEFTVVPEVSMNVGYQFTNHIRAFVGYNFLYWSSVLRPGNQIDRTVNTNQLPPAIPGGPARPDFAFRGSDFWAQGMNLGLEFRY